jgi:DNA-binding response OmpR family regulator
MGAIDYIKKPFSSPALVKRIETHIEPDWLINESLRDVRNGYGRYARAAMVGALKDL